MANVERVREVMERPLEPEYFKLKSAAGWKLIAVEWEREVEEPQEEPRHSLEEIPYGLRVSDDCLHLVENPAETEVLIHMLDGIVQDLPFSKIAEELNRSGLRTRSGSKWEPVLVLQHAPETDSGWPAYFLQRGMAGTEEARG